MPPSGTLQGQVKPSISLEVSAMLARRCACACAEKFDTSLCSSNAISTRVIKLGQRPGDAAPMSIIELVDREEQEVQA